MWPSIGSSSASTAGGWMCPTEIDDDAFWQEFRSRVRAINPEAYIVGEIWHESHRWLQGDQFDAIMNYDVTKPGPGILPGKHLDMKVLHQQANYHGIHHAIDAHEFANRIDHNLGLYKPDITYAQLNLLDSHDTPRFLSCASGDKDSLKLAWLFMFTYPGAPCIYYGDEIGLDGSTTPTAASPSHGMKANGTRICSRMSKELIALRKQNPALRRGDKDWSREPRFGRRKSKRRSRAHLPLSLFSHQILKYRNGYGERLVLLIKIANGFFQSSCEAMKIHPSHCD
jgi:glycosidase